MAGTNQFVPFGTGNGANVASAASWAANNARQQGFVAGVADPVLCNTAWRQPSVIATTIGRFVAAQGYDALDDGNLDGLYNNYVASLVGLIQDYSSTPADTALWHYGVAGGSASALVVSTVVPAITGDQDFLPCLIRVPAGVSANATLTIGTVGGALQRNNGNPIQDGDCPPGSDILVARHSGVWRLVGFGRAELQAQASDVVNIIQNNPSLSPPRNLIAFTSAGSGTFTVPDKITWIYAEVVGGGGGGHGGAGGVSWAGGGGGSGGYSAKWIAVTPGQTISYVVGAGGAGSGNTPETFAPSGTTTSFGSFLQASGGGGGRGGSACNGGTAGLGSGGQKNLWGGNGGDGNPFTNTVQGGAGAASALGGGGRTATIANGVMDGLAPGSGGGGIWGGDPSQQAGGRGADGAILISY